MRKLVIFSVMSVFLASLALSATAFADHGRGGDVKCGPKGMMGGPKGMMMGGMGQGMRGGGGMGHVFGSHWRSTLSDEQELAIDRMHRDLKKQMGVLKARIRLEKAELAALLTEDNPDKKAITEKIDRIADLKKEKMRKKYDHKIDMRAALTPEQRVSFDMDILRKAGRGKGRGGRH
ncbi:MAG: Spy/CpxP family protein refolding chaperone [Candidatus Nitrospinota bacterium M3_3B_026]